MVDIETPFELDITCETFSGTVSVPQGTSDDNYRVEVEAFHSNGEALGRAFANIIVQTPIEEIQDISLCLKNGTLCLDTSNVELNMDIKSGSSSIATSFLIENKGTIDVDIALELVMPNGDIDVNSIYVDEGQWNIGIYPSPSDTKEYSYVVKPNDFEEVTLQIFCKDNPSGTYTFNLKLLSKTESTTNEDSYLFEVLDQITLTVTVEGETVSEEGDSEGESSLLPGPSFITIIALLTLIVYRRKH